MSVLAGQGGSDTPPVALKAVLNVVDLETEPVESVQPEQKGDTYVDNVYSHVATVFGRVGNTCGHLAYAWRDDAFKQEVRKLVGTGREGNVGQARISNRLLTSNNGTRGAGVHAGAKKLRGTKVSDKQALKLRGIDLRRGGTESVAGGVFTSYTLRAKRTAWSAEAPAWLPFVPCSFLLSS